MLYSISRHNPVRQTVPCIHRPVISTRNSSGNEIGPYSECELFTTTSSTTFTQCAPEATEFGEVTQNKGHYAVKSFKITDYGTNRKMYGFLLVINTNLPPFLAPFPRYSLRYVQNLYIWLPVLCLTRPRMPRRRGSPGTISVNFSVDVNGWPRYQMA